MYGSNPATTALFSTTTVGATAGVITLPDTGTLGFMFYVSATVMAVGLLLLASAVVIKLERRMLSRFKHAK